MSNKKDIFSMPLDALDKHIGAFVAAIEKAEGELEGLVALTTEERKTSQGRFRSGEADALLSVLDAAEKKPQLFESLADKDFGEDPEAFEVSALRDRLQRAAKLVPLADKLDALNTLLSDTVLSLSSQTKPVMLQGYGIAKSVANTDAKLRTAIAPAIDYYGKIARQAAATRKKAKAEKA